LRPPTVQKRDVKLAAGVWISSACWLDCEWKKGKSKKAEKRGNNFRRNKDFFLLFPTLMDTFDGQRAKRHEGRTLLLYRRAALF